MTDRYRFDDAYETVSVYDEPRKCYLFCGTYWNFGITKEMSDSEKVRIVNNDPYFNFNPYL